MTDYEQDLIIPVNWKRLKGTMPKKCQEEVDRLEKNPDCIGIGHNEKLGWFIAGSGQGQSILWSQRHNEPHAVDCPCNDCVEKELGGTSDRFSSHLRARQRVYDTLCDHMAPGVGSVATAVVGKIHAEVMLVLDEKWKPAPAPNPIAEAIREGRCLTDEEIASLPEGSQIAKYTQLWIGVHSTHCCPNHEFGGCKYGDDDCPVCMRLCQGTMCEDCSTASAEGAALAESMRKSTIENYWRDTYAKGPLGCCTLCGNTGVIDTTMTAISDNGIRSGKRQFCFCPNGKGLRDNGSIFLASEHSKMLARRRQLDIITKVLEHEAYLTPGPPPASGVNERIAGEIIDKLQGKDEPPAPIIQQLWATAEIIANLKADARQAMINLGHDPMEWSFHSCQCESCGETAHINPAPMPGETSMYGVAINHTCRRSQ